MLAPRIAIAQAVRYKHISLKSCCVFISPKVRVTVLGLETLGSISFTVSVASFLIALSFSALSLGFFKNLSAPGIRLAFKAYYV